MQGLINIARLSKLAKTGNNVLMRVLAQETSSHKLQQTSSEKQVASAPVTDLPKVISLFSGAGGLDLGFKNGGFDVVFAADNMRSSIETHKHNFPSCRSELIDLASTEPRLVTALIREVVPSGSSIAIIGGPPCQGFSRSNSASRATDPRNQLIEHYCDIICSLQQSFKVEFIIFENVLGIKDKKHLNAYSAFLNRLKKTGLTTNEHILLATDFGVPQTRKRIIVLGSRHGNLLSNLVGTETEKAWLTVRTAFANIPEPVYFQRGLKTADFPAHPNHWTMQPKSKRFDGPPFDNAGRSFRQLKWDAPSPTIAMGHREIPIHPNGNRRISIWESMRLQGFPDSFQLKGSLSDQVVQVSNAVPPPLAEALAITIRRNLQGLTEMVTNHHE